MYSLHSTTDTLVVPVELQCYLQQRQHAIMLQHSTARMHQQWHKYATSYLPSYALVLVSMQYSSQIRIASQIVALEPLAKAILDVALLMSGATSSAISLLEAEQLQDSILCYSRDSTGIVSLYAPHAVAIGRMLYSTYTTSLGVCASQLSMGTPQIMQ